MVALYNDQEAVYHGKMLEDVQVRCIWYRLTHLLTAVNLNRGDFYPWQDTQNIERCTGEIRCHVMTVENECTEVRSVLKKQCGHSPKGDLPNLLLYYLVPCPFWRSPFIILEYSWNYLLQIIYRLRYLLNMIFSGPSYPKFKMQCKCSNGQVRDSQMAAADTAGAHPSGAAAQFQYSTE